MKRLFDILFSGTVLLLLAPIFLIVALGIYLSSPGPVFYRAKRVGLHGELFEMLKFRSMHVGGGGAVITSHGDSRIFGFGRLIRKLKLDELPQFVNVLRGDMSIVGPRPEDPKIVEDYYTDWMKETLDIRPGITGPGSVFYYICGEKLVDPADPEQSYANNLLPPKLAVERGYMDRAAFWGDMGAIFHTVLAVIGEATGRPAKLSQRDIDDACRWVSPEYFEGLR